MRLEVAVFVVDEAAVSDVYDFLAVDVVVPRDLKSAAGLAWATANDDAQLVRKTNKPTVIMRLNICLANLDRLYSVWYVEVHRRRFGGGVRLLSSSGFWGGRGGKSTSPSRARARRSRPLFASSSLRFSESSF